MLAGLLVFGASDGASGADGSVPGASRPAEIELRKSFRAVRRAARQHSRPEQSGRADVEAGRPGSERSPSGTPEQFTSIAAALGEQLQSSGTLHLPGVGKGGIVLECSKTPILETVGGRRLIIDRDRTIGQDTARGINRAWPDFMVVQPPGAAGLREVLGSVLDAAGYDSVLRSAPLILGRGVTVRITPDFVVLRDENDLLEGETRALSVVEPADALPWELRELAGEHHVRVSELTPDGFPSGDTLPRWREPIGRVTTMETARAASVIAEITEALGYPAEPPPAPPVAVNSAADLPQAIDALLKRLGVAAIGPVVEFSRATAPGATRRFVISAPGWLAESAGRRLLITNASPPPLVRLFLTREGIDIFEYRVR